MLFDHLSVCLMSASFILAPITILIVGSQNRADAKAVTGWTLGVLVPFFLATCARFVSGREGYPSGASGMVVLCFVMIASVGLGYWIATSRPKSEQLGAQGKKVKPAPWDDELV